MTLQDNRDRAVIARIGGNLYRERLADVGIAARSNMADKDRWIAEDAASLASGASYRRGRYSAPWSWTEVGGATHHDPAAYSGADHFMSPRNYYTALLPEAAFDWPIYRAATWMREVVLPYESSDG